MKHIRAKLLLAFFGMAALAVGLIWLVQAVFLSDSYLNQRVKSIDSAVSGFSISAQSDYAALESALNVSLLAINDAGSVVYQSDGLPMRGQLVKRIPELLQAAGGGAELLQSETEQSRNAVLARSVEGGTLLVVFSLVDVSEASRVLLQQLWVITGVLLVAALVLSLLLSRRFSRPVVAVTNAAKRMAAGDYSVKTPVTTRDEIGQLTQTLNELGDELGKVEELRRELIANVSHELRAPLSIIRGYAETVRDVTWPIEEKRTGQLNAIVEESARLGSLVSDILDYSRLQSGTQSMQQEAFSARDALGELISRFELAAGQRKVALELRCDSGEIWFDRGQFAQVVSNLLDNAVRHAREGSRVLVHGEWMDKKLRISVENAGDPIPPEVAAHLFDRFYRADSSRTGTGFGLGLAIARAIVQNHRGNIICRSQEGLNRFSVTLPILRQKEAQ